MSIILAIETATSTCSVCVLKGEDLYCEVEETPNIHTQVILPMIDKVITRAEISISALDAIAVGRGPGSFTGVRIGVSAAQGLGFGLNLPVYPISTLAALSFQIREVELENENLIIPAIDARMQEVYMAKYTWEKDKINIIQREVLISPKEMLKDCKPENPIIVLGSGWDEYAKGLINQRPELKINWLANRYPEAKEIALLAKQSILAGEKGLAPENVLPVYLRHKVAEKYFKH